MLPGVRRVQEKSEAGIGLHTIFPNTRPFRTEGVVGLNRLVVGADAAK